MYIVGLVMSVGMIVIFLTGTHTKNVLSDRDEIVSALPTPSPTQTPSPTNTPAPANPSPTSQQVSYTSDDLERWFSQYGSEYGVDKDVLRKIASCESGFNARSYNQAGYAGMFQFSSGAWQSARRALGRDDNPELRFNAEESIRTAAFKISGSGSGAWPTCSS